MSVKDDAFDWGYNAAAGKAAYENEVFMKCIVVFVIFAVLAFVGWYVICKIEDYKAKKREEKNRIAKAKRKKKREVENGR
ncbi:hypothetical protein JJP38_004474 [Salmonella enterica]|nr:hypothetical protein [Salmonella enterica]